MQDMSTPPPAYRTSTTTTINTTIHVASFLLATCLPQVLESVQPKQAAQARLAFEAADSEGSECAAAEVGVNGALAGEGVYPFAMHGRSHMTTDPREPTLSGLSSSGFQTLLVPSAKRHAVFGESHEG